jgi:hypothetical protein
MPIYSFEILERPGQTGMGRHLQSPGINGEARTGETAAMICPSGIQAMLKLSPGASIGIFVAYPVSRSITNGLRNQESGP